MADATITAYGAHASAYRDDHRELPAHIRSELETFAAAVGAGRRVLEIGSGGGRDAAYLESRGLQVRRTDATPAFVDLLREEGLTADVLDPLHDDLTNPDQPHEPYDAIWANACLLHVQRVDLPTVLERLRHAVRPGGLLRFSVKGGDGEAWVDRGPVTAPRLFVYWSEHDLHAVVHQAGWATARIEGAPGSGGEHWLEVWTTNGRHRPSA